MKEGVDEKGCSKSEMPGYGGSKVNHKFRIEKWVTDISLPHAVDMLVSGWRMCFEERVINCFKFSFHGDFI